MPGLQPPHDGMKEADFLGISLIILAALIELSDVQLILLVNCLSDCLPACLSVSLPVYLSVFVSLFIGLSACLSDFFLSVRRMSARLSVCMFACSLLFCQSFYETVCWSADPRIRPFLCLPV